MPHMHCSTRSGRQSCGTNGRPRTAVLVAVHCGYRSCTSPSLVQVVPLHVRAAVGWRARTQTNQWEAESPYNRVSPDAPASPFPQRATCGPPVHLAGAMGIYHQLFEQRHSASCAGTRRTGRASASKSRRMPMRSTPTESAPTWLKVPWSEFPTVPAPGAIP
jgi:hypothetical protein